MNNDELEALLIRLETNQFDETDIKLASIVIEELLNSRKFRKDVISYLDLLSNTRHYTNSYE